MCFEDPIGSPLSSAHSMFGVPPFAEGQNASIALLFHCSISRLQTKMQNPIASVWEFYLISNVFIYIDGYEY